MPESAYGRCHSYAIGKVVDLLIPNEWHKEKKILQFYYGTEGFIFLFLLNLLDIKPYPIGFSGFFCHTLLAYTVVVKAFLFRVRNRILL
ncbi:Uncharacterised protein [Actinobacillus pleuropneumoniae]|nr:Uncharacterised protein [Actinobacillus pleuropneumoniae]